MAGRHGDTVYIGIGGHVVAIAAASGEELWRQKLKHASFVTISVQPDAVYAGATGELFCLDPVTGEVRWRNRLKGLGIGLVSFAESPATAAAAAAAAASHGG